MSNRTIEAIVRLSAKLGSMAAFGQLGSKMTDVNRKAAAFNRTQTAIAKSSSAATAALMRYAAPAAIAYGAQRAVREFAGVERTLTRIGINADASREQMAGVYKELQQLAQDTATPVENLVAGLDSLIASGKSLDEARALIGSVAATAQAAGADFGQMATTADAVSNSFGIAGSSMQAAFDILAKGGKAGKFELRDMAAELPSLAPAFAALGYEGEDGLKRLTAALQTVRMETGTSGEAATSFMDVLTKMNSVTVSNNFKKQFGVDLRNEMKKAKAAGEDTLEAFIRLSKEAVNGDMSRLPLLFTDKQMLIGMRALMNHTGDYTELLKELGSAAGSVDADLKRVLADNQASIDKMANAWDRLKTSIGETIAPAAAGAMDMVSGSIDRAAAVNSALEETGTAQGWWERTAWGATSTRAEKNSMAWRGGYRTEEERELIGEYSAYGTSRSTATAYRMLRETLPENGPVITTRDNQLISAIPPTDKHASAAPVPETRPSDFDMALAAQDGARDRENALAAYRQYGVMRRQEKTAVFRDALPAGVSPREAERESMLALRTDPNGVADAIDMAAVERATKLFEQLGVKPVRPVEDAAREARFRAQPTDRMPFPAGASPREAERESMLALRTDPNGVADAIDMAAVERATKLFEQLGVKPVRPVADAARTDPPPVRTGKQEPENLPVRPEQGVSDLQGLVAKLEAAGAQGGSDLARGGDDAASAISEAAPMAGNGFGDAAAARIQSSAAQAGAEFGDAAAARIRAAVSNIQIRGAGAPAAPAVTGNRGRTMPRAGKASQAQ